ncbi:hypothetical protein [Rufibacter sp. XAAS-G3-1]|uniref:hypothetical protein n=1 Tax=Rufibacter sp. XAAS-G3-1 TaxID=2729134 RepID=UPI0015E7664E|nr:hypothetical protein [Rufibacter sp. XAAS-G3-1]
MKSKKEKQNLVTLSKEVADLIKKLQISHVYMASILFAKEWDRVFADEKDQEGNKRKLTGRLRNKIQGSGYLTDEEFIQIQNILLNMADTIQKEVRKSMSINAEVRKEKIQNLIQFMEEDDKNEALK